MSFEFLEPWNLLLGIIKLLVDVEPLDQALQSPFPFHLPCVLAFDFALLG